MTFGGFSLSLSICTPTLFLFLSQHAIAFRTEKKNEKKSWTCVYPIYLDAKRPYGTGQRRVARPKSLWWPLSKDIADAANRLGLGTLHEVSKSHPRDWENPGRVRVQWKKDGRLVNPIIKSSMFAPFFLVERCFFGETHKFVFLFYVRETTPRNDLFPSPNAQTREYTETAVQSLGESRISTALCI